MRKDIHPAYMECTVRCSCGNSFKTRSTVSELRVELCNECHPFYTGQQKFVDTGGRVQRFADKYGSASAAVAAREAARKAERQAAAVAAEEARKAERDAKAAAKAAKAEEYAAKATKEAAAPAKEETVVEEAVADVASVAEEVAPADAPAE